jgi:hypothetical protein
VSRVHSAGVTRGQGKARCVTEQKGDSAFEQLPPLCNPTRPALFLEHSLQYNTSHLYKHIHARSYTLAGSLVTCLRPACAREIRLTPSSDLALSLTCLTPTTTATTVPAMKRILRDLATQTRTPHVMHNRPLHTRSQLCGAP